MEVRVMTFKVTHRTTAPDDKLQKIEQRMQAELRLQFGDEITCVFEGFEGEAGASGDGGSEHRGPLAGARRVCNAALERLRR